VPKLLASEAALPANADPLAADLSKPDERATLARLLLQGLDRPRVRAAVASGTEGDDAHAWQSSPWPIRRERVYLLPATRRSACACRSRRCRTCCRGSGAGRPSIRSRRATSCRGADRRSAAKRAAKRSAVAPKDVIKTALCVEVRDGHVHVFMPPLMRLEDYVELLAASRRRRAADAPVVIEGYTPPRDPRIRVLNVTPDPGVIEVNVHPASSWDELVAVTETLYDEARAARLSTEKFMQDGRHTGTGGGNHVTLGGATPRTARCCAARTCCKASSPMAEPSGAVVSLFRARSSADQPVAARRRGARRPPLRARDRVPGARAAVTSGRE
jgi:uncharacterized protein (DUF2126 family)